MAKASQPRTPLESAWWVVPVYNDATTIEGVVAQCRRRLDNVVVVDDGSTDTDVAALFSGTDVTVLSHEKNLGKGAAIRTGLEFVRSQNGRVAVTIDADGQLFPADLEAFLPLSSDGPPAIVIGARRFEGTRAPGSSRFGRRFGNFWLRIETGQWIEDCQSGFRAYPVEYIARIRCVGSRFDFEAEILARAVWAGLELRSVPVRVWYPEPHLRVSRFRPVVDNLRLTGMHTRLVARGLFPWPHRRIVPEETPHPDLRALLRPRELLRALLREGATPLALATSAAVGILVAALPLVGLPAVVARVAKRLGANETMALTAQHVCLPPLVPLVCLELGHRVRAGRWLTDFSWETMVVQAPERLLEWLLGALVVGPTVGALVAFWVYAAADRIARQRRSGETDPRRP